MTYVLCEITDGVALVTLNDPEKRNAVNLAMNEELVDLIERLEADIAVGAMVVTGAAPAFCAGADLSALISSGDDRGGNEGDSLQGIYRGFLRVAHSTLPTLAAVNGAAVGAGMNMALACDVILAGRSARFDTRFLQIGLHPGGGHTWRLREKTSDQVARAMVLFGEVVDGSRATEVGLAWRCVEDAELLAEAHTMAARAAAAPPKTVRSTKKTLNAIRKVSDSLAAVEHEVGPQVQSARSPEFRERTAALREQIRSRSQ